MNLLTGFVSLAIKRLNAARQVLLFSVVCCSASLSQAGYFPMFYTWPQPDGPGSPITLTYSFSNLFDGSIRYAQTGDPIATAVLHSAFTTALWDYASVLPIHFVEVVDTGPLPETGEYDPDGLADIRIGQVANISNANAYAYFPFDSNSGLAGDVVFNAGRFGAGWTELLFYVVAQHELGHVLGMGHYVSDNNSTTSDEQSAATLENSAYDGPVFPLDPLSVEALQEAYGSGVGSVTPLTAVPLPAAVWFFGSALLALVGLRRRYGN